jgi:hypothetical protein
MPSHHDHGVDCEAFWGGTPDDEPPAGPAVCHKRPVCCCEILPDGFPGLVSIGGTDYLLSYHATLPAWGEPLIRGYRLVNLTSGATYDLDAQTLACDCPDALWRRGACKHSRAIWELRARGDVA